MQWTTLALAIAAITAQPPAGNSLPQQPTAAALIPASPADWSAGPPQHVLDDILAIRRQIGSVVVDNSSGLDDCDCPSPDDARARWCAPADEERMFVEALAAELRGADSAPDHARSIPGDDGPDGFSQPWPSVRASYLEAFTAPASSRSSTGATDEVPTDHAGYRDLVEHLRAAERACEELAKGWERCAEYAQADQYRQRAEWLRAEARRIERGLAQSADRDAALRTDR